MNQPNGLVATETNQPSRRNMMMRLGTILIGSAAVLLSAACDERSTRSTMIESQNARTIERVYQGFEKGDVESILALMADDVEWVHPGPETIPFAGTFRGKEGVERFFAIAIEHLDVLDQRLGDLLAHEDKVVVFGAETMRVKSTGREYQSNWIHFYTVTNDRIVRFEEYIDTAAVAEGFRPREGQSAGTEQN